MSGENEHQPFHETATAEAWIKKLYAWAGSHAPSMPVILDNRWEVIYGDMEECHAHR